jgi:hypothetical protein
MISVIPGRSAMHLGIVLAPGPAVFPARTGSRWSGALFFEIVVYMTDSD